MVPSDQEAFELPKLRVSFGLEVSIPPWYNDGIPKADAKCSRTHGISVLKRTLYQVSAATAPYRAWYQVG